MKILISGEQDQEWHLVKSAAYGNESALRKLLAVSPEVIECKLAANREVKHKVIGQVIDCGAHLWDLSYDELAEAINRRPSISLADLAKRRTVEEFLRVYDWVVDEIQST